ncbi:hypothetical protein Fmac_001056 [Flemingia macrophylla]|uniref:Uncharacterized protein n=1 Tax=Flemingia macrophylla TaxID=520843 RepID=A0ABD1NGH8_9FABA
MESFGEKGKETEELQQRFNKLEQEWQTFKESKPTKVPHNKHTILKPHKYSPRKLMYHLQQESPEEAWKNVTSTKDIAVQEILQERREAIERGKLKGRRLFHSPEEGHDHEVRSMSYYNSENDGTRQLSCCSSSFSSSSSSCLRGDNDQNMEQLAHLKAMMAEMRVASVGKRGNGRTWYAVFLGGVAVILLVIAMCMSLARSSRGGNCNVFLVPT